jgi:crotonobetainyl-CoA:carnitine CoA-transferase CaiB-like acyl-CoA transferase
MVDVSLFESLFSLLGPLPAEYAVSAKVRSRIGSRSTNSGPRGCYATSDGSWIALSGSTPKMAERFLESYGLAHVLRDPRFGTNEARVAHAAELDAVIRDAVGSRTSAENVQLIEANQLTAHPVQTIEDIERDPHWQAQQLLVDISSGDRPVRMHAVTPRLSESKGDIRFAGRPLGADNDDVFGRELGLGAEELERLRQKGVI